MASDQQDGDRYLVVVNDELQYSIWRADLPVPAGWRVEGEGGSRDDCLAHIDRTWTDMRPLSLRTETEPGVSGRSPR